MAVTRVKSQDIGDGEVATVDIANDAVDKDKLGILTTKGDLITFSTEPIRLPVGVSDGQVLTVDAASTGGIKWAAATGGLSASNFVDSETPSGTVNGSNPTFTLANTPTTGTLKLYKNGLRQNAGAGNDYTLATATITFLTGNIPQTGDVLLADYMK